MSRLLVPRMLATGSLVGAATAARVGSRCAVTVLRRTPPLIPAAVRATTRDEGVFRDELIALARETAEVSWRELRRGLEEFDLRTRPAEALAPRSYRPTRVKP